MKHQQRRRLRILRSSRCTCGLGWPCPDSIEWPAGSPVPDGSAAVRRAPNRPSWDGPTVDTSGIGRAGRLTPAQAHRANGGRW
jgi:hypothetical protein